MMGQPKPNIGAVTAPGGNPGNAAAAMADVRNAVTMLEKALPNIPMGTPLHHEVLSVLPKLTKHLSKSEGQHGGLDLLSLLQAAKQSQQQSPMAALSRLQPPPGSPPATPQPDAGAGGGAPPMPMAA